MERASLNLSSQFTQPHNDSNLSKNEITVARALQSTLTNIPENTASMDKSLVSMLANGMKIIQGQAQTIEAQAKLLQQQEIEIEKLRAELKNAQKKEQNQKKEAKLPTAVNTASIGIYEQASQRLADKADRLR